MTGETFIFVHGTGVRTNAYTHTFKQIKHGLEDVFDAPVLVACFWGQTEGAELKAEGRSIPDYVASGGDVADAEADTNLATWSLLYVDPGYELRLLGNRRVPEEAMQFGVSPEQAFERKIRDYQVSDAVATQLDDLGLGDSWQKTGTELLASDAFTVAKKTAEKQPHEHVRAYVRAWLAGAIMQAREDGIEGISGQVRDKLFDTIVNELGSHGYALEWLTDPVVGFAKSMATRKVRRSRGSVTDAASPAAGDILLYQARGQGIHDYILDRMSATAGPVHVIAHSLGGIACVDLLIENDLENVASLITIGSQAPFLYEINALKSLEFGNDLPSHFPKWLNVYDLNDFLSYRGSEIFTGNVRDVKVDNQQPFPEAHSAYWTNVQVWRHVRDFIDGI